MSLVDYASSDEDDEQQHDHPQHQHQHQHEHEQLPQPSSSPSTSPSILNHHQTPSSSSHSNSIESSSNQPSDDVALLVSAPIEKLPDASLLLSSPFSSQTIGGDHSSRVAAAMAENASRKREANGSSSSGVRGKIPRGILPHSKNIPDTGSGLLTPPQLRGRSNVVTEDINKLFVQKKSQGKS